MSPDRLALGFLSVFALPPLEFVDLAANLGCQYISTVVQGQPLLPLGFESFSLKNDVLRNELLTAMNDRGVKISLGDGFLVLPDAKMQAFAPDLDVLAELGVPWINAVSLDPDLHRTFDQFGVLAELAAQRNIRTALEPVPGLTIGDLPTALVALEHVGRPDFRLLIDTMHLIRSGSTVQDLVAVDPAQIGYAQLCDTTFRPRVDNYLEEAMYERMVPGEGELPLRDILDVLPDDVVVELEIPRRSLALAGVSPLDRLRPCVDAARTLLLNQGSARPAPRECGGSLGANPDDDEVSR